jgi:hypothetical protein
MALGSATVCARPRGLDERAAPPGDSSEYCGLVPLRGVSSVCAGGERALRLLRFVDSGGGGPRRLARSDVLERLDSERWRCSIVMSSSKEELRRCTEAMRWHDALPRASNVESRALVAGCCALTLRGPLSHVFAYPRRTRKSGVRGLAGSCSCAKQRSGAWSCIRLFRAAAKGWKPVEALDDRCNGFPKVNAAARQRALRAVGEVRSGLAIVATNMGRPGCAR